MCSVVHRNTSHGQQVRRTLRPLMASLGVVQAGLLLLPGLNPPAFGQLGLAGGLGIDTVVTTVLADSPEIAQSLLAVDAGAAERIAAAGPFDFRMRTSIVGGRDNLEVSGTLASTGSLTAVTSGVKRLRSGVVISTDLSLGRFGAQHSLPLNQADSSVSIRIPLAGGRDGGSAAGVERSAQESYRAAVLERGHVSARAVLHAITAYWRYVAAQQRLETRRASAVRADALVEATEALIRADERPASDRDVIASNLANKRTAVLASQQAVLDARYALGIALGLQADEIENLGPAITEFPIPAVVGTGGSGDRSASALARTATTARRDLAAAHARRDGARFAWQGALRDLRPRWDIVASVGHTGISFGPELRTFLSPLVRSAAGLNTFLQIQYEPIVTNSSLRGIVLRTETAYRSATVRAEDLTRRIQANARAAAEALDNATHEVASADEAVRLSERSVDTEQAKFGLGLATLFDAILSTDTLTDSQLRRTDARYRYAVALARLRFETGTLLTIDAGRVSVDVSRVTTLMPEGESP